jgi:hypothetical protein
MELSVIVATTDARRSIDECLRRLQHACAGLDAELIVVDASSDGTAERVAALDVPVRLLRLPVGTLTPELWAEGCRRATGRLIAFTTGHCCVTPRWASVLTRALDDGASGAGGPLVLSAGASPLDRAVYYLRYSAFMPGTLGSGRTDGEIAGDNAMYRRTLLDRHAATLACGFWEVDFHRLLRADGGWLAAVPAAVVDFGPSFPLATILRHRFAHGVYFGAGRVAGGGRGVGQIVLAAPLVPFVLLVRAGARVIHSGRSLWSFGIAVPWFLLLSAAWAAGEAWGALASRRADVRGGHSAVHGA